MQPNTVTPRYLSMTEAAAYSGMSIRMLRQLIKECRLPTGSWPRRRYRCPYFAWPIVKIIEYLVRELANGG